MLPPQKKKPPWKKAFFPRILQLERGSLAVRKAEGHSPLKVTHPSVALNCILQPWGWRLRWDLFWTKNISCFRNVNVKLGCLLGERKKCLHEGDNASFLPNKSTWAISLQLIVICPWFCLSWKFKEDLCRQIIDPAPDCWRPRMHVLNSRNEITLQDLFLWQISSIKFNRSASLYF